VPFVRLDWFVSTATQSPLYEDLLQLPRELSELEALIGVEAESNLQTFTARRAGMTLSGVSRNNRVVERHPARYGAYWKSFDFETSKGLQNMFADPINFHFAGGEMIWNLPNGLQAYLVTDTAGNRILEAPTSIVTDKFAEDKTVRNGLACMRCHDRGIKRFADNVRPAFETLADTSGLDKSLVLKLYAPKSEMDTLIQRDETRFMNALQSAVGTTTDSEPLVPVSRQFLDAPLNLSQAASELGLKNPATLQAIFRLPQFTSLGLAGLSGGSVIRRDTWEDSFDQVAQQVGVGIPIAPVDGNTRLAQLADGFASGLKIQTSNRSNIYSPGEEMFITVTNETNSDLFIELIGTSASGRKVRLTEGVMPLAKGGTYRFPETGAIQIKAQLGAEFITVFANPTPFTPGVLLRGDNLADRFVHDFYVHDSATGRLIQRPTQLVKKTLKIETR
jgi:serine/threonine-protein kinase